jgi:GNAT superfamily N-acetyltransferase
MWSKILSDDPTFASTVVWVAEDDGRLVGFGSCGRQREHGLDQKGFDAEISAIYILLTHQGLGLGRALMGAMASNASRWGHRSATLWVVRENEIARRFYERLGGIAVAEKEDVRSNTTLVEVAYGWHDLISLVP